MCYFMCIDLLPLLTHSFTHSLTLSIETFAVILENTKFSHGYSQNSKVVGYLLDVLTEFTPRQRRAFLMFVTGTPRLPIGGMSCVCVFSVCLVCMCVCV
jgi:hypothetical protein